MQDFITILSNFGFPVAVASYLLFRFEKKLETLEQSNRDLKQSIMSLTDAINGMSKNCKSGSK
jgi:hypothetical protein